MSDDERRPSRVGGGWPELPDGEWGPTRDTLHMWTQIVGKVRMELTPWVNHSWGVALYLTSRGLTTDPIPHGDRTFQVDFDFVDHGLVVAPSDGGRRVLSLRVWAVADFHDNLFATLGELGLDVEIDPMPNEVEDPIPFPEDRVHEAYDREHARRIWGAIVQTDRVFRSFRARFIGKCSPVHFFWGAFDLAVTHFSGREAPDHSGGVPNLPDEIAREAYSHEVSSAGFWPGNEAMPVPVFYSYAYPEPEGFAEAEVRPVEAQYSKALGEWVALRGRPDRRLVGRDPAGLPAGLLGCGGRSGGLGPRGAGAAGGVASAGRVICLEELAPGRQQVTLEHRAGACGNTKGDRISASLRTVCLRRSLRLARSPGCLRDSIRL